MATATSHSDVNPAADAVGTSPESMLIGIYSDDRNVRRNVMLALGARPAVDVSSIECVEFATAPALTRALDRGLSGRRIDVLVLDAEAVPAGGMGLARQIKDEVYDAPPVVLIVARPQDAWLAAWSRADAVITHPIDPRATAAAVASLMREQQNRSGIVAL